MGKFQDLDASSVGILDMKARQQNCITLEELVDEKMPLLSRYVLNTTEEILVFTDLGVRDLKRSMAYLRRSYPYSRNIS